MTELGRDEITHHLHALRSALTPTQSARLAAIRDVVGDDGRFALRDALAAAEFPATGGPGAFEEFRTRVNSAASAAGVNLQLELDSQASSANERYGWFTGSDLVDEGIASFTSEAAGSTGVAHSVAPEVRELGEHRRIRVYVSFHPITGPKVRRVDALLEQLRDRLGADPERSWDVVDPRSVGLGEDPERTRDRLSAEADVRVALISPAYLADPVERGRVLDTPGVVGFALSALPDGPVDLGVLERHEVRRRNEPWDELNQANQKKNFVADLEDAIRSAPSIEEIRVREALEALAHQESQRKRFEDPDHLVPSEIAETTLRESRPDGAPVPAGPPLLAVDRLVDWATERRPNAPRLCALLGDVGMGKTTTAKLFTQRLLEHRAAGRRVPLPILFDLRDVRVEGLAESMTLDRILDTMLDARRPAGVPPERLCAEAVRQRLDKGDAVVIFDGLDEILVHLGPHDRQLFTRQLWRALSATSSTLMLLTCRTQYFRTIRDQVTFFTGEDRQGLRGDEYLALLMLPFRDAQVREYLAANLHRTSAWVDGFLETIAAVHDLPDLTRRPLTLRLIADQLEFIENAKLEGRTLRSVDIYSEVVERWLSRDSGKHTLEPDHKRLLMEEIAASLWRSGRNEWTPAEVDDWLLDVLDRRPDLRRHYREPLPDLWKADFRTATFLKREGDTFQFGHRSLFEYFLARHLFRTLHDAGEDDRLLSAVAMPVPSEETLEFLGQSIAAAPEEPLAALRRIGRRYLAETSELALAYALHAARHGHPQPDLADVHLEGARLSHGTIGSPGQTLSMTGAHLSGADLARTTFTRVDLTSADLTGANLTLAELHDSRLVRSRWVGAQAAGTILRGCDIEDADLEHAETYRTQLLFCTPKRAETTGILVAPMPSATRRESGAPTLRALTPHRFGSVRSVAWSPDGTRLLSGHDDGARIWDATTGEVLRYVACGRSVAAWSPDGSRLLTGGEDATVRVWDAATGEIIHTLTGHTGLIATVAWSPDSTRLLTGGATARVWDADTGKIIHTLTGHTGLIATVAWSPGSVQLLTGGETAGTRIWDATTGDLIHHNATATTAAAWSPDGRRLLTGSRGGAWILDAATYEVVNDFSARSDWVTTAAWSPDGTCVLTSNEVYVIVWDSTTSHVVHQFIGHTDLIKSAAWSPDGTRLLTGGDDATIRVWHVDTGETILRLTARTDGFRTAAWSPDSTRILTGDGGGTRVWNATTGEMTNYLRGGVAVATWSPDGTRLLTGGDDATIHVRDASTGQVVRRLPGGMIAAWSPDSCHIVAGNRIGMRVWDATTGEITHFLVGGHVAVWSPDSSCILIGDENSNARVCDPTTGKVVSQLASSIHAAAWSPDGTRILTGGPDHVRIWDANAPWIHLDITTHTAPGFTVAWSPDGTRILTGGRDGAHVWDATTGEIVQHLTAHADWVRSVAWSPDGTRLLTCSTDGVWVWDATTGQKAGFSLAALHDDEIAMFDAESGELLGASAGAWRWLGWTTTENGRLERLPAEYFGALPATKG